MLWYTKRADLCVKSLPFLGDFRNICAGHGKILCR